MKFNRRLLNIHCGNGNVAAYVLSVVGNFLCDLMIVFS
jgi:hypothetical protein